MSTNKVANPASVKQENFINKLMNEAPGGWYSLLDLPAQTTVDIMRDGDQITKSAASGLINALLFINKQARALTPRPQAETGYYVDRKTGDFIVVVESKRNPGKTYGKLLTITRTATGTKRARWEYVPGLASRFAGMTPMTLQEAAQFGHLHGICVVCTRRLTDPESVKNGIGPVCAKRFRP